MTSIDAIRVPHEHDKRRKLSDTDREKIHRLFAKGVPLSTIAEQYSAKCSRRAVEFVLFPKRNKKKRKSYYNTKKNTKAKRRNRAHKRSLLRVMHTLSPLKD